MKIGLLKNKLYQRKGNPYHVVLSSPWPLVTSWVVFSIVLEIIAQLHNHNRATIYLLFNLFILGLTIVRWSSDIIIEGSYEGRHTKIVQKCLSLGFSLFILSEIMFFGGLFGSYIYTLTNPTIWIGCEWPPSNLFEINPFSLPLANAFLLVTSGLWGEIAHVALSLGKATETSHYLMWLMILGSLFLGVQFYEYMKAPFGIDDSVYGSLFFFITGFHGLHVCMGLMFIYIQYFRIISGGITRKHHLGFDFAILYWHFVDVIWLIVWYLIYFYPVNF